jgi:hypothetical protein
MNKQLEELAKIAYHAYGQTTDFKNYQGLPMPEWDELPPKIQLAWANSSEVVSKKTIEKFLESIVAKIIGDAFQGNTKDGV